MNSAARAEQTAGSWPPGASRQAVMSIGQVLEVLRPEFPGVSVSKLRFLEDQGLITPKRAASGYRKYCQADVERLRFVLAAQRDHFWPLRVIRERLEAMDAGLTEAQLVAKPAGEVASATASRLDGATLSELTGATADLIAELANLGLLRKAGRNAYGPESVQVVTAVVSLATFGLEPRHLGIVAQAATRQADLVQRVTASTGGGSTGLARQRAEANAGEICELMAGLHRAVLRDQLAKD